MAVPQSFAAALPQLNPSHKKTIMFTIGGEDWGAKWKWTASIDDAVAMAHEVATWRKKYPGLSGIDIDAENQVEQSKPEVMAAFVRALKAADPGILVSLCVYGNPEGRTLHNYLVNTLLSNATVSGIDWINVMGCKRPFLATTHLTADTGVRVHQTAGSRRTRSTSRPTRTRRTRSGIIRSTPRCRRARWSWGSRPRLASAPAPARRRTTARRQLTCFRTGCAACQSGLSCSTTRR